MGISPAMTRDFHAPPSGVYGMDKFLDTDELFKHTDLVPPRQSLKVVIGAGNVTNWSNWQLSDLGDAVAVARKEHMAEGDSAVYVIGTFEAGRVKVGRAGSPTKRLAALQTGSADKLYIHRVFWFREQEHAIEIEKISHQWIGRTHTRLKGEWFNCGPVRAHKAVEQAADMRRYDCAIFTPGIDMGRQSA